MFVCILVVVLFVAMFVLFSVSCFVSLGLVKGFVFWLLLFLQFSLPGGKMNAYSDPQPCGMVVFTGFRRIYVQYAVLLQLPLHDESTQRICTLIK